MYPQKIKIALVIINAHVCNPIILKLDLLRWDTFVFVFRYTCNADVDAVSFSSDCIESFAVSDDVYRVDDLLC